MWHVLLWARHCGVEVARVMRVGRVLVSVVAAAAILGGILLAPVAHVRGVETAGDEGVARHVSVRICSDNRQEGARNVPSGCGTVFPIGTAYLYVAVAGLPKGAVWRAVVSRGGMVVDSVLAIALRAPSVAGINTVLYPPGTYTVTVMVRDEAQGDVAVGLARFVLASPWAWRPAGDCPGLSVVVQNGCGG
jgi:hypothetical protein